MFAYRALFLAVLRGDDCLGFLVPGQGSPPSICSEEDIDITSLRRCSCYCWTSATEKSLFDRHVASLHTTPWYTDDARPSYNLCGKHIRSSNECQILING